MPDLIIQRLSLVIHLIDTTTGGSVNGVTVSLKRNGKDCETSAKGEGRFIILNEPLEDFTLFVDAYGYEEEEIQVCYEKLDPMLPTQEVYLIPKVIKSMNAELKVLQGVLPGIKSLEAVSLNLPTYYTRSYDPKKRIIEIFNPYKKTFDHKHYGIIKKDQKTYEKVDVVKQPREIQIQLKEALNTEFEVDDCLSRIIFGKTAEDGSYLLRVVDDATRLDYLVRYEVEGETYFQKVSFDENKVYELSMEQAVKEGEEKEDGICSSSDSDT